VTAAFNRALRPLEPRRCPVITLRRPRVSDAASSLLGHVDAPSQEGPARAETMPESRATLVTDLLLSHMIAEGKELRSHARTDHEVWSVGAVRVLGAGRGLVLRRRGTRAGAVREGGRTRSLELRHGS
jgi:hypothetical protein